MNINKNLLISLLVIAVFSINAYSHDVYISPDNPVKIGQTMQIAVKASDEIRTVTAIRSEDSYIYLQKENDGIWYGAMKVPDNQIPAKYELTIKYFYSDGTFETSTASYIVANKTISPQIAAFINGLKKQQRQLNACHDELQQYLTLKKEDQIKRAEPLNEELLKRNIDRSKYRIRALRKLKALITERNQLIIKKNLLVNQKNIYSKSNESDSDLKISYQYLNQLKMLAHDYSQFQNLLFDENPDFKNFESDQVQTVPTSNIRYIHLEEPVNTYLQLIEEETDLLKQQYHLEYKALLLKSEVLI